MIELLVTIVIMGLAFEVIVGGLSLGIVGSNLNRRAATSEAMLRTAAEGIKAAPYQTCATLSTYLLPAPPDGRYEIAITSVTGWNAAMNQFVPYSGCTESTDSGLQLVEIAVSSRGLTYKVDAQNSHVAGSSSQMIQVVKRA